MLMVRRRCDFVGADQFAGQLFWLVDQ